MSADADVIRCVAPWPGSAAQLLEGLAVLGPGAWAIERICVAASAGLHPGDALPILTGLEMAGVCTCLEDGESWSSPLARSELQRLSQMLRGADHFRRLRSDASSFDFVVTMPLPPSFLAEHLAGSPGRPGGYLPTSEAFLRVARAAKRRIVVLTPFIDRNGFGWLRGLLGAVDPGVERIIVLREVERLAIELSVEHRDWLEEMRVKVFDYHLPHPRGARVLPIETFHAKIVVADDTVAYVGSANVLGSGDGTSLEAGVLVDGRGAAQAARLVDGILQIARSY
jgi:phosphatidylserine/phosphatidylglycerophosphate/cardiolipin synthase-like enzyme